MENSEENLCFSHTMLDSVNRETVHSLGGETFKGKSKNQELVFGTRLCKNTKHSLHVGTLNVGR